MKPLVIYHAHCCDGFGAAFAAWLKFGDEAEYLPMSYGFHVDDLDDVPYKNNEVYMIDFSWPKPLMDNLFEKAKKVVWLDHHKTAFEMYGVPIDIITSERTPMRDVELDNNKSGAILAWEYFHPDKEVPMLIRHIDDRDRWQFKLNGSKGLHAALASMQPWSFEQWEELVKDEHYGSLFTEGAAILRAQNAAVKRMAKQARSCTVHLLPKEQGGTIGSVSGLACNSQNHISELGHELANQSGTFGLVWYLGADNKVKCSLRSNGDYDVSAIAKALGGGGHLSAAGCETTIETLMGWLK